ncbi:TetR/AcrR family transcriptional regulator [Allorhizobium sp. BGMRC 0089]|nr:TetR/AcrR family transcriptional regulator [Allorhizobium sonneratiae]
MADIAMTLHMSPANVFKHFHSKIDLVDAIISSHLEKKLQAISHINLTCSPQKKLFQVAEILLINFREDVAKNPHLFEMVIFIANMELKAITLYRDGLIAIIKSVIDEGVDKGDFFVRDTHHAAQTALCALEGVFNPITIAREKPDTLLARCHDIVDLIITALQNPLAK